MFAYPPRLSRQPPFDGHELHVHGHRVLGGISSDERELVIVFLKRYAVWCARARHFGRVRNAVDLPAEIAAATP